METGSTQKWGSSAPWSSPSPVAAPGLAGGAVAGRGVAGRGVVPVRSLAQVADIDVVGGLEDAGALRLSLTERVLQALLETKAIGHHEVGCVHRLEVLGRRRPVVRVDTVGHEDRHARPVVDEVPDHGPQDRGGHHDVQAFPGGLGLGGRRSGLQREQGEAQERQRQGVQDSRPERYRVSWTAGPAARAATVELEPVGVDQPAGPPLDVLQGQADLLDLGDTAAA